MNSSPRARRRFHVALKDGVVVGSRWSARRYTHAVLHFGLVGTASAFTTSSMRSRLAQRSCPQAGRW